MSINLFLKKFSGESRELNPEIRAFLKQNGRVFQQPDFLKAVSNRVDFFSVEQDGEILSVWPIAVIKKFKIKAGFIPQHAHVYGPVWSSKGCDLKAEVMWEFKKVLSEYPLVELKLPLTDADILPFLQLNAKVLATQTHIVESGSNFGIESIHHSKKRYLKKLIQLLEKGQLVVKEGADCHNDLLKLQGETAKKSGFATDLVKLKDIMKALGGHSAFALVVYDSNGMPLSGAYCPFDSSFAYHVVNASVNHEDTLLNRSNILSTYLAIEKAMKMGLGFDFEGSNILGVASYYRLMGGKPTLFYRIELTEKLLGRLVFSLKHFAHKA